MPSWKVSMRDSMSNQTSHFGIMGGLYNRKVSGRSSTNRATSRLTIPTGAAAGLKYMKMHNLLSKNPLGSGGVGNRVKSKPCNCGIVEKPEVKEDTHTTLTLGEVAGDLGKEHIHFGASLVSSNTHDPVSSIVGICNKFFVQMTPDNGGVFGGQDIAILGFIPNVGPLTDEFIAQSPGWEGNGFAYMTSWYCDEIAPVGPGIGCRMDQDAVDKNKLTIYDHSTNKLYYYSAEEEVWWASCSPCPTSAPAGIITDSVYAMCSECKPGYIPNASAGDVTKVNKYFSRELPKDWRAPYGNTYGCSKCPAGFTCDGIIKTPCDAGTSSVAGSVECKPCNPGTFSMAGGVCAPCAAGTSSGTGAATCTPNTCKCHNGTAATSTACTINSANICAKCNDGFQLDISTCVVPACLVCPPGQTNRGCGKVDNILSPGICISNNLCRMSVPYMLDITHVPAYGDASNGYFCCDYVHNVEYLISDISYSIPSCNMALAGKQSSCVNYIPEGKKMKDVNCNNTLHPCYWPIDGQCSPLNNDYGNGWQPGRNTSGDGHNLGTGWIPFGDGMICPPTACYNKAGKGVNCMSPP